MSGELGDLVRRFEEDLQRGAADADGYCREVADAARGTSPNRLFGVLNEALRRLLGVPLGGELDALHPALLAGALFRAACESEGSDRDAAVLLGYAYAAFAVGRPADSAVFLLAAAARGRADVAARLLGKIGLDPEDVVRSACGAVGLARFLEDLRPDPAALLAD
jgi:hypothetical protein